MLINTENGLTAVRGEGGSGTRRKGEAIKQKSQNKQKNKTHRQQHCEYQREQGIGGDGGQ